MRRSGAAGVILSTALLVCSCSPSSGGSHVAGTAPSSPAASGRTLSNGCDLPQRKHASAVAVDASGEISWRVPLAVSPTGDPPEGRPVTNGRTAYVAESGVVHAIDVASGRQLWAVHVGDGIFDVWALHDTVVALADQVSPHAVLMGIAPTTGVTRWVQRLPGAGALGDPVATADGGVALVRADGALVVFDGSSGKPRWTVRGRRAAGLVSAGRIVVHAGDDGSLVGFDSATGRQVWRSVQRLQDPALALADGLVLVTPSSFGSDTPTAMVALDPASGRVKWRFDRGEEPPTVLGAGAAGIAVSYANARGLALLDPVTGRAKWTVQTANSTDAQGVAVGASDVLVQEGDVPDQRRLEIVDRRASDGRPRWRERLGSFVPGVAPMLDGGTVVVAGPQPKPRQGDALRGYDLRTGRLEWTRSVPGSIERPAAEADGRLVFWAGDLSFACAL